MDNKLKNAKFLAQSGHSGVPRGIGEAGIMHAANGSCF